MNTNTRPLFYILDDSGNPKPEPDTSKAARWLEKSTRTVAKTTIGDSEVSTVFLGINRASKGEPPILWETMVFGGTLDGEQERCSGRRPDAFAMHKRMVQRVKHAYSKKK